MSLGREDLLTKRWHPPSWRVRRRISQAKFQEKIRKAYDMRHNPTPAEAATWKLIKGNIQKRSLNRIFFRQSVVGGYILDFYCPNLRLDIEIDGSIHDDRKREDAKRDFNLRRKGITTIRFSNEEIFNKPKDFIEKANAICEILERKMKVSP